MVKIETYDPRGRDVIQEAKEVRMTARITRREISFRMSARVSHRFRIGGPFQTHDTRIFLYQTTLSTLSIRRVIVYLESMALAKCNPRSLRTDE